MVPRSLRLRGRLANVKLAIVNLAGEDVIGMGFRRNPTAFAGPDDQRIGLAVADVKDGRG
jgi:hypothetical protein